MPLPLPDALLSIPHRRDVPFARLTTLGVGGLCRWLFEPVEEAQAQAFVRTCAREGLPWRMLGGGCNLVVLGDRASWRCACGSRTRRRGGTGTPGRRQPRPHPAQPGRGGDGPFGPGIRLRHPRLGGRRHAHERRAPTAGTGGRAGPLPLPHRRGRAGGEGARSPGSSATAGASWAAAGWRCGLARAPGRGRSGTDPRPGGGLPRKARHQPAPGQAQRRLHLQESRRARAPAGSSTRPGSRGSGSATRK